MADEVDAGTPEEQLRPVPAAQGAPAGARFRILKMGQGIHIRWLTVAGVGLLAMGGMRFAWRLVKRFTDDQILLTMFPLAVLLGTAALLFWLIGRHVGVVDFLIATEGEMKKVSWSSRREVWGATKVVIVTVLALALILFLVDLGFILFFSGIGVLKFDVLSQLLRLGQGAT
jgi:preprotein translocase subunit SecE